MEFIFSLFFEEWNRPSDAHYPNYYNIKWLIHKHYCIIPMICSYQMILSSNYIICNMYQSNSQLLLLVKSANLNVIPNGSSSYFFNNSYYDILNGK